MLPIITFRTTTGGEVTTHSFGNVDAGSFMPGSSGWEVRIYNDYDGDGSEDATSVKINARSSCGETDLIWHEQHWVEVKSYGYSTGSTGMTDDNMSIFQPVGENSPLGIGDIASEGYRTLFVRINAPTDAQENDEINLQLVATYQDPQTAITKWITGLRGNGVVASTGDPFEMSTGGTAGTIPYKAGYALIDNNEIYYGSSGSYTITTTTGTGTFKVYLDESGAFNEKSSGESLDSNELLLYEATYSTGVCTALDDKRVYLSGLQVGTTGAMPTTPDLGDLYLATNGKLYAALTAGDWTVIVPGATFIALTDTPDDYSGDANKLLRVDSSSGEIEFVSTTGLALDGFGTPSTGISLNATTGRHGLLPLGDGDTTHYLAGDVNWVSTTGIVLDSLATPTTGTALNATTGLHGLLPKGDADTTHYLAGDISWVSTTGIVLDSLATPTTGTALNATTGVHGLLPMRDGNAAHWLDGAGLWTAPTASEVGALESSGAFTVNTLAQISTTGGVIKASPFLVTTGSVMDFGAHSAGFTEQAIATTTGTVAVNWNNGNKALYTRSTGTAGGAATFTFTAPVKSMNLLLIVRGSTAGCTGAVTLPTVYWGNATYPTFSTGVSAIDGVALYYSTGLTKYLGLGSANFSTV